MPTFIGTNPERQSIGLPGHCDRCAEVGHVKAHPDLGCGDVGCNSHHPAAPPAVCPTCHSDDCEATWGKECPVRYQRIRRAFQSDLRNLLQRGLDSGAIGTNPNHKVTVITDAATRVDFLIIRQDPKEPPCGP